MKLSIPEFHHGLHRHFNVRGNAGRFLDTLFLQLGQVKLDVMAFDDWLHEQHGDYEDEGDGISMADLIKRQYGMEAYAFVRNLI